MKKDIVILANFCGDFSKSSNGRFSYLANELAGEHNVEIITSDFSHGRKEHKAALAEELPYKVTFIHEPGYPKNLCLKRFWSHFVWGKNVKKYLSHREKPDVIYCAIPSLTAPLSAAKYCEKNAVKFIVDVQDLWPEAFQMVFHVPVLSDLVFAPFKFIVNGIYRRADEICAVSKTYVERALSVNRKCAKGHTVFLGTRLERFDKFAQDHQVTDKPRDELWLGYCGTLGASYDLTCVFDALELVTKTGVKAPKFIVMGNGPRRVEFENYAKKKNLDVVFTGRLPYDEMCSLLSACDIVVNPITKGAAQSIINKHADYAACGKPVLNTQECEEYRQLVTEYHMGLNCKNSDAADLADKLLTLLKDETLRKEMGANARRCAEERFDRERTYQELTDLLLEVER